MSDIAPADAVGIINALIRDGRHEEATDLAVRCDGQWPNLSIFPLLASQSLAYQGRPQPALSACLRAVGKDRLGLEPNAFFMALLIQLVPQVHWPQLYEVWRRHFPSPADLDALVATLAGRQGRYDFFGAWSLILLGIGQGEEAVDRFAHCLGPLADAPPPAHEIVAEYSDKAGGYDDDSVHRNSVDGIAPHLTQGLGGRAGQTIIDAGCGTGLAGRHLRPLAERLIGIDLSPDMVARCRDSGLYDTVIEGDLIAALNGMPGQAGGIAILGCAYYFPDLAPMLTAARNALVPGGRLMLIDFPAAGAKSVRQTIGGTRRYCRSAETMRDLAAAAGLVVEPPDIVAYFNLPSYLWTFTRPE
ncbi:MAG: methyltransferase domain-containing protein [Alphaproteobacteria bacterium]|nr:methyltransferase domain-containing protein [Alphaproteobacteria bacterium]